MESHGGEGADAGSMGSGEAAAGSSTAASSSTGQRLWKPNEQQKVVAAARLWFKSVVRIIKTTGKGDNVRYTGTGNAFVVYAAKEMSVFLTCEHTFQNFSEQAVIRLHGETQDYPIDKIHYRDKTLDLLVFSVKNCPILICPPFSLDMLAMFDLVALVGYSSPTLTIDREEFELALVKEPTVLPGEILKEPELEKDSIVKYQMNYVNDCPATVGISGAPMFNEKGQVVGIHLDADKSWREAVSVTTLQQRLTTWLRYKDSDTETIEKLVKYMYEKISRPKR